MIVDLSHPIRDGLITYPGLPAPTITPHLSREASRRLYAAGTEFAMDVITLVGNTGTYLDSPFHRYEDGVDLAGLDLETLVDVPATVVRRRKRTRRAIDVDAIPTGLRPGDAVLFDTGWDQHFGTDAYAVDAPFLTEAAANELVAQRVGLVGIDSINIDDISSDAGGARPAHTVLLGAGIQIVEHLTNLERVPDRGALFTAAPPAIERFGTFPVRAYATFS